MLPSNPTDVLLPVYRRADVLMTHGEGCYLFDSTGKRYLDFASGIATNALGHAHPAMIEALQTQAGKLWHCSNMFRNEPLEAFAEALCKVSFAEKLFFCSSGTEAVEAAIKTIRRYHYVRGDSKRTDILTVEGGFHGRTTGALAACSNAASKEGFLPLMQGFQPVPFHDIAAMRAAVTPYTAAIMLETVQGEGGIREHSTEYLQQLRQLCDEQGILLFLDEIQCGYGRTGTLFAFEQAGIAPDICTAAKGIGGGFPLAAMLATSDAAQGMTRGTHGSTYGSNPLACAVGLAVLTELQKDGFLPSVQAQGAALKNALATLVPRYPHLFTGVRGRGLMLGLALADGVDKYAFSDRLREAGLIVSPAVSHVLRILPPLIITSAQCDEAMDLIQQVCKEMPL